MKTFSCCILVCVMAVQCLAQEQNISFTIQPHGWALSSETNKSYLTGEKTPIKCIWKNEGRKDTTILLSDHHDYHGTLEYPVGMEARVIDAAGHILTQTKDFGEWWTWYYLWSTTLREMPGDRITLKPGEEVMQIVPLNLMLRGLNSLTNGLKVGEYNVELKLGDQVSNKMKSRSPLKSKARSNNSLKPERE